MVGIITNVVEIAKIPNVSHVVMFIPFRLPKKYTAGDNIKGINVATIR
jgi:hypothetical protein